MILKLSTSGTHLRSDMAHNAKAHCVLSCWADLLHVLLTVSSTSCQICFLPAFMVVFQIVVNIHIQNGLNYSIGKMTKRGGALGKKLDVPPKQWTKILCHFSLVTFSKFICWFLLNKRLSNLLYPCPYSLQYLLWKTCFCWDLYGWFTSILSHSTQIWLNG